MLDFRHRTFLTLCQMGSYTKTAKQLHITQPAVTQHIRFLEEHYGGKLLVYTGKAVCLTERGKRLQHYVSTLHSDCKQVHDMLKRLDGKALEPLLFGATLTIGEYVMPRVLMKLGGKQEETPVTMQVGNTKSLLRQLDAGTIDFALLEGFFDKQKYNHRLFSTEAFIAVCAGQSDLAHGAVYLEELLGEHIILREKGSGTRDIFEHALFDSNLTASSFRKVWEIGNMNAIKKMVASGMGITFLYRAAVQEELENGTLSQIEIKDFHVQHEFHFVYLKGSAFQARYDSWFVTLRDLL